MKKSQKQYTVNLDMVWSREIRVKASNKPEAKKKAFIKLLKILKQSDLRVEAEEISKLL